MSLGGGSRPFWPRVLSAPTRVGGFAGDTHAPPQPESITAVESTQQRTKGDTPQMWIPEPPSANAHRGMSFDAWRLVSTRPTATHTLVRRHSRTGEMTSS